MAFRALGTSRGPATEDEAGAGRLSARDWIVIALVLVSTCAVYLPTRKFDFVFDDRALIIENPLLRSWRFVPHYFTQNLTSHLFPHAPSSYYRPGLLLWLFVNYTLFQLKPWCWHLTTLVAHLSVTLSVYLLARRILRDTLVAGATALVFGLHPVHVESVAWVMGVVDPLPALLLILSLLAYLRGRERIRGARGWAAASLIVYALALLTKENALVLPLIVLAHETIFRARDLESPAAASPGRRIRRAIAAAAPYVALTTPYLIARVIVLKGLSHAAVALPLRTIILTWPSVLCAYLRLLVWPFGLSAFYGRPYVTTPGFSNFVLPVAVLAGAALGLAWWAKRSPAAGFATAWLVLPILPTLNLSIFPEGEIVHDRYLYLPSVGFSFLVALALRRLSVARFPKLPVAPRALILAIVCSLGLGTVDQSLYWANNLALYRRGVAIAPHNNLARNNLANELLERGLYNDAVGLYGRVLADKPDYWLANYNLGFAYYKLGKLPEAERYLRRAIEISPIDPDQFVYLGVTYLKMGRLDDAAHSIRHALELRPDGRGYHFALGTVMKAKGDFPAALAQFKTELAYNPEQKAAREQISEIEARLR